MFGRLASCLRTGRVRSLFRHSISSGNAGQQSGRLPRFLLGSALAGISCYAAAPWEVSASQEQQESPKENKAERKKAPFRPPLKDINSQMGEASDLYLFVGSYTDPMGHCPSAHATHGITVFRVSAKDGSLEQVHAEKIPNCSFLALGYDQDAVYAVSESGGFLASYRLSPDGQLQFLNRLTTTGESPCNVSLAGDAPGYALVANYMSGEIVSFAINSDGSLAGIADLHSHFGKSINPIRQEGSHPHAVVLPDSRGDNAFVPDLGLDRVYQYKFNAGTGVLRSNPKEPHVDAHMLGAGPRHLKFSPDRKHAYVCNELASSVSHFRYLGHSGRLYPLETVSTLPQTVFGPQSSETPNSGAEIQVHPSGDFVYVSNRGDNSIAAFSADSNGALTLIGHYKTRGLVPRNFCLDPSGRLLYVANQESDTLEAFKIKRDGSLKHISSTVCSSPAFVKLAWLKQYGSPMEQHA